MSFTKIFFAIALILSVSGCATKSRATHLQKQGAGVKGPIIIDQRDIEPSQPAAVARPAKAPIKAQTGGRHTVRPGETLWAISKLYGVDVDELAKINSLNDAGNIEVGQVLILPGALPRTPVRLVNYSARRSSTFIWPVNGTIASRFGSKSDKFVNKGVDIRASDGSDVYASRGGKIVYCDSHLKGFGQTVIIDHMDGFQTVYSYNQGIFVKVGDMVEQKEVIAKVGSSGRAKESMLHFEIRKNGEPQNPEFYLSR